MDQELHAVGYAFDAAFQRLCEAKDDDALMAELSNLLHHLFRLRELCRRSLGGCPQLRDHFTENVGSVKQNEDQKAA